MSEAVLLSGPAPGRPFVSAGVPPGSGADASSGPEDADPDLGVYESLLDLARLATHGVRGCDHAGISLLRDGFVVTVASTDRVVGIVDAAEYASGDGPCLTAMREGGQVVVHDLASDDRWPEVSAEALQLGIVSVLSLPLHDGQRVVGGLNLYGEAAHGFTAESQRVAKAIASQGGIAVRNLALRHTERTDMAAERRIAEALQRSLLPVIPHMPGVTSAYRYLPSGRASQVGGDWYDAFPVPGGAIGVAIGDVMGHDVVAAAAMGQLRSVLRSFAYEGYSPAVVLDRLDRLVQAFDMAQVATVIYARLLVDEQGAGLTYCNAGHLPPLVQRPDGTVVQLTGSPSPLIGAPLVGLPPRNEAATTLPAGSTVIFFTDGLVESRDLDIDVGIAELTAAIAGQPAGGDPDVLCETILQHVLGTERNRDDDIALLTIRIDGI